MKKLEIEKQAKIVLLVFIFPLLVFSEERYCCSYKQFSYCYSDPRDTILAHDLFYTIDSVHSSICSGKFDTAMECTEPVDIEVLQNPTSLAAILGLSMGTVQRKGIVAVSRENKIFLLSPRAVLRGYRWRRVLANEYLKRFSEIKVTEADTVKHALSLMDNDLPNNGDETHAANRWIRLAGMLLNQERTTAAINELEKAALAVNGSPSWILTQTARLYLDKGNSEKALQLLSRAISLYPDDCNAYFYRALILLEMGELKKSVIDAKESLAINPFHMRAREMLIEIYEREGLFEESRKERRIAAFLRWTNRQ